MGLVVGAGGQTGGPFIHAALDELHRLTGWAATSTTTIVGTSAGAFVAASINPSASSPTCEQLDSLRALQNGGVFAPRFRHRPLTWVRRLGGVVVARVAPRNRPFAEYRVPGPPYHPWAEVVTVERGSSRRVVHRLSRVDDAEAVVRASAAIPGLNQPVELDGGLHVDGAVFSAANIDVVSASSHDVLVVIAPMVSAEGGSVFARADRAQLRTQLEPWIRAGKPAIVILPNRAEHVGRRDREAFQAAGRNAVERLVRGSGAPA